MSASFDDGKISWSRNLGGGAGFGPPQAITHGTETDGPYSVFAADLTRDGHADVLSASFNDGKIAFYRNLGDGGGFGPQEIITTEAAGARAVCAADIDNDGFEDAVSVSADRSGNGKIAWYRNQLGEGGGFGAQQVIGTPKDARALHAADVDADGFVDIVGASNDATGRGVVAWYRNNGHGGFGPEQVISSLAGSFSGVFATHLAGSVFVLSASGTGTVARYSLPSRARPAGIVAYVTSAGGSEGACGAATTRAARLGVRPCATLGAAVAAVAGAARALPAAGAAGRGSNFASIVLGGGRLATGGSPVALVRPPGVNLLVVQIDEAGSELVCPGIQLASSCVTVGPGVALIGGPLTVSGGRTQGDGGCMTVHAGGGSDVFRVPLFNSAGVRPLEAFSAGADGVYEYVPSAAAAAAAGDHPAVLDHPP